MMYRPWFFVESKPPGATLGIYLSKYSNSIM